MWFYLVSKLNIFGGIFMFYDRKIKYLDYLENKERIKGVGFVRVEVRDDICELHIQVNGMHITDNFARKLMLVSEEEEAVLCEITLEKGRGCADFQNLDSKNLADSGISYMQLCGIRIPIAAGKEIYCSIQEAPKEKASEEKAQIKIISEQAEAEALQEDNIPKEVGPEAEAEALAETEPQEQEDVAEGESEDEKNSSGETDLKDMSEDSQDMVAQNIEEFVKRALCAEEQENDGREKKEGGEEIISESQPSVNKGLQENKWGQLASIYPHVRPFRDERDYLSISPGDFVVLTEKYYGMANNSFLLHGYYNYRHLILGRIEKRGSAAYYVGVPGNFYEREKQVALLFGFESFECSKEPARPGDYGYYMMKVEL